MFIVQLRTSSGICYLRNTIWTFADGRDRATEYATVEAAQAALDKAKKFMKAQFYKAAQIVAA
jgi:hypothetical protein